MALFKNLLIECRQCNRKILVKPTDTERREIVCSHSGCGAINPLVTSWYYSDSIMDGLSETGTLTDLTDSATIYPLKIGQNTVGVGAEAILPVPRTLHHNQQCFISRLHCTLTVTFDKWLGQLRYQLQDGVMLTGYNTLKVSKNGTMLNNLLLKPGEIIDVPNGGLLTLGGMDTFCLTHHLFSLDTLKTYKTHLDFDPDRTD